jgi:hypothetical protein
MILAQQADHCLAWAAAAHSLNYLASIVAEAGANPSAVAFKTILPAFAFD